MSAPLIKIKINPLAILVNIELKSAEKTFIETLDITASHLQSINKRRSESGDIKLDKRGKCE